MTFEESLPPRGRRLVRRLEAFGDIVFGFSISELALQLGVPKSAHDIFTNPLRYALFFGTFAILASLWLRFHRLMTTAFAPHRFDLIVAFGFLAFSALVPYALYASVVSQSAADARYGFAAYIACLGGTQLASTLLDARALARGRAHLDAADLGRLRQRAVLSAGICVIFTVALALDLTFSVAAGAWFVFTLVVWTRFVRWRFPAQSWSAVHVGADPSQRLSTSMQARKVTP